MVLCSCTVKGSVEPYDNSDLDFWGGPMMSGKVQYPMILRPGQAFGSVLVAVMAACSDSLKSPGSMAGCIDVTKSSLWCVL